MSISMEMYTDTDVQDWSIDGIGEAFAELDGQILLCNGVGADGENTVFCNLFANDVGDEMAELSCDVYLRDKNENETELGSYHFDYVVPVQSIEALPLTKLMEEAVAGVQQRETKAKEAKKTEIERD